MNSPDTETPVRLAMVTLDCADPQKAAQFWAALLGWEQTYGDENAAMLRGPSTNLGFGRVPDYEPPAWPNDRGTKQFHFDLAVDDIPTAEARCVELGATVLDDQPGDGWRVLRDPGGHPFCLTNAANW